MTVTAGAVQFENITWIRLYHWPETSVPATRLWRLAAGE